MSGAPYWWPDTTKPDGVPYIKRDGERNPERGNKGDRANIGKMIETVQNLALASYITDREIYAKHAKKMLQVWFLDTATRMNPHLKYAQSIRGRNEGRGAGIIDSYGLIQLIDALQLLSGSKPWSDGFHLSLQKWFDEYLTWLRQSENGKDEANTKNNHGTTYAVQVSFIALFVGKDSIVNDILRTIPDKRIATQIEPDGTEPYELLRTKSWGYSLLNLEALVQLAMIGDHFGIDLWHYTSGDGRSIKKVIDWLLPYALGEKQWSHPQIVPIEKERLYPILRIASVKYKDQEYRKSAERIPGIKKVKQRANLIYPQ